MIPHRPLLQWQEPQEVEVQAGSLPGDVMRVPPEARLKRGWPKVFNISVEEGDDGSSTGIFESIPHNWIANQ